MKLEVLKVLDGEIDRINNHYKNLIEQAKKERDKKIQDCRGIKKYQALIEKRGIIQIYNIPQENNLSDLHG